MYHMCWMCVCEQSSAFTADTEGDFLSSLLLGIVKIKYNFTINSEYVLTATFVFDMLSCVLS